jgi:hypothetical protein
MGFQWDPDKDASNCDKHGIAFREAAEIFRGFVVIAEDLRRAYGERRWIALGEYDEEVIRLVYTVRGDDIRIISAWKANRHDRETYEKARKARQV